MSAHRLSLAVVCSFAVLASGYAPAPRAPSGRDPSEEIARIRHHLEGAEAVLLSRDDSTLTAAQRAARARLVVELRAYRLRGVFPHNHQWLGRRTPVFVDEHETRCAMAYLIEQSGAEALVSRIASTRNLARIRDLAGDPELGAWLDRHGLTLDEAARIQPEYEGSYPETESNGGVWAASVLGAGAGVTGIGLNVSVAESRQARNTRGLLGVVCGLAAAGLGVPGVSEGGAVSVLGAIDIGAGLASVGLGIRQINATGATRSRMAAYSVAPAVWRDGGGVRWVGLMMRF